MTGREAAASCWRLDRKGIWHGAGQSDIYIPGVSGFLSVQYGRW